MSHRICRVSSWPVFSSSAPPAPPTPPCKGATSTAARVALKRITTPTACSLSAALNWPQVSLNYDSVRNATYADWRLPTTLDQSCFGDGCTGSEMGHLYYSELGGTSTTSLASMHGSQYDLFENIQAGVYWLGTAYELNGGEYWQFDFGGGHQSHNFVYQDLGGEIPMENLYYPELYAWAIHDGDWPPCRKGRPIP